MSIREVTFEELLAILRSPPKLVAKAATPPENPDRYMTTLADSRELVKKQILLVNRSVI
jgi:hypothetical protein